MSDSFSPSRRIDSFRFASRGIVWMLRTQHNAWIHALATVAVLAAGVWLRIGALEWCWLVVAVTLVWTAEAFNSALEQLADRICSEPDPHIGRAKDAAAGAVLICAIAAVAVGVLVLGPRLLAVFARTTS